MDNDTLDIDKIPLEVWLRVGTDSLKINDGEILKFPDTALTVVNGLMVKIGDSEYELFTANWVLEISDTLDALNFIIPNHHRIVKERVDLEIRFAKEYSV